MIQESIGPMGLKFAKYPIQKRTHQHCLYLFAIWRFYPYVDNTYQREGETVRFCDISEVQIESAWNLQEQA